MSRETLLSDPLIRDHGLDFELEARAVALVQLAKALGDPVTALGEREATFFGSPTSATALDGESAG